LFRRPLSLSTSRFQNSRMRSSRQASRRVLTWPTSSVSCSIIVKCWASSAKRASGGSRMSVAAAVQRAIKTASMGSFFGMLKHNSGVGTPLPRREDDDPNAARPARRAPRLLITAARLDTDALDLALPQPGQQAPVAFRVVVDLRPLRTAINRDIQLVLAGIDAGAHCGILAHLRRPLPCDANPGFLQPSGSDEEPIAILLSSSPCGSRASDPTTGGPV